MISKPDAGEDQRLQNLQKRVENICQRLPSDYCIETFTPFDGACFFHSVIESLKSDETKLEGLTLHAMEAIQNHSTLREAVCIYLNSQEQNRHGNARLQVEIQGVVAGVRHRTGNQQCDCPPDLAPGEALCEQCETIWENWLVDMTQEDFWAEGYALQCTAQLLQRDIWVTSEHNIRTNENGQLIGQPWTVIPCNNLPGIAATPEELAIHLVNIGNTHFQSLFRGVYDENVLPFMHNTVPDNVNEDILHDTIDDIRTPSTDTEQLESAFVNPKYRRQRKRKRHGKSKPAKRKSFRPQTTKDTASHTVNTYSNNKNRT